MGNWINQHLEAIYNFLQYFLGFGAIYIPTIHKTTKEHNPSLPAWIPNPTGWGWIFIIFAMLSIYGTYKKDSFEGDIKNSQFNSVLKDINTRDSANNIKSSNRDKKNDTINSKLSTSNEEMKTAMAAQGFQYNELSKNMEKLSDEKNKIEEEMNSPVMDRVLNDTNPSLEYDSKRKSHFIEFTVMLQNKSYATIKSVRYVTFNLINDSICFPNKVEGRWYKNSFVTDEIYISPVLLLQPSDYIIKKDSLFLGIEVKFTNKRGQIQEPYYDFCMVNANKWTVDRNIKDKMRDRLLHLIKALERNEH